MRAQLEQGGAAYFVGDTSGSCDAASDTEVKFGTVTNLDDGQGDRRVMIHSPHSSAFHEYTAEDDPSSKSHVDDGEWN